MTCTKRHVTFVWALLECLLFTGLIFGWPWFLSTLRRNKYFLTVCNVTLPDEIYKSNDAEGGEPLMQPGGYSDFDGQNVRQSKCRRRTTTAATQESRGEYFDFMSNYTYFCDEQEEKLEVIHAVVFIARNVLVFPFGIFLDMYGTTRTRLLTILIFIIGTLMMTFSNASFPWLIIPAFSLFSAAGCVIMITNLQISNLFGERRYTVMSSLVGAYHASAVLFLCIKLMNDIQTSFMFMTMGVVPILVSTIAFLPKTKIPWPLPADYGDGRTVAMGNSSTRNRAHTAEDEKKCCLNLVTFKSSALSSLFIWSVLWFSIYQLRSFTYDSNLRLMLITYGIPQDEVYKYSELFAAVQTLSLPVGPLIGLIVDWKRKQSFGDPVVLQMKNVQFITFLTFGVALINNILTTIPYIQLQVAGFIIQTIERVAVMTTVCSFLTHVHFPADHFGKLIGLHFLSSSILCLLRFPFQVFINTSLKGDPFYINLLLLVLLLLSCGHPFVIWYHCKVGLIKDNSHSNSSSNGREQLVITIEDENDNSRQRILQS